jgi:hypothetical protein
VKGGVDSTGLGCVPKTSPYKEVAEPESFIKAVNVWTR